jgi:hypothetical protein
VIAISLLCVDDTKRAARSCASGTVPAKRNIHSTLYDQPDSSLSFVVISMGIWKRESAAQREYDGQMAV